MTHAEVPMAYAMTGMHKGAIVYLRLLKQGQSVVTDCPDFTREPEFWLDYDILYGMPNAMARRCVCKRDHHFSSN